MKYKLINTKTKEETFCDKVTIDGFDYYVSDEIIKDVRPYKGKWQIEEGTILNKFPTYLTDLSSCRLVIATTNPNIDVPKVVDEVENIAYEWFVTANKKDTIFDSGWVNIFKGGYCKSQETHPFSEEDMIEFAEWLTLNTNSTSIHGEYIYKNVRRVTKELIQTWKEQQPKIVYYEN